MLGHVLGEIVAETEGPEVLEDVERLRRATMELRGRRGQEAEVLKRRVVRLVDGFDLAHAGSVARAFTVYFQLVNLAEERHRVRTLREWSRTTGQIGESLASTVSELRSRSGEDELGPILNGLEVRPVLTAHPTEARRRAVVDVLRRIGGQLERLEDPRLSIGERASADRGLREQVSILWRTAQLRREQPGPLDEVRTLMSVFDETLFQLVPLLYREVERALSGPTAGIGTRVPPLRPFLHWGSWVGGDRDGNPLITHEVTRATMEVQHQHALRALERETQRIGRSLTVSAESTPPSADLLASLAEAEAELAEAAGEVRKRSPGEPHRRLLLLAAERLAATRRCRPGAYPDPGAFLADLRLVQDSLAAAGADRLSHGELQDLVWQAETFGFHLASLEVRQHSGVHRAALGELLPDLGLEAIDLDRFAREGAALEAEPTTGSAAEVLATLRVMKEIQAAWGAEACRRYLVSFTRSAADVTAVRALARLAVSGGGLELDVVPLFESRRDLEAAPRILGELLELPGWREWLESRGRRLEVMLGYSDAAKDIGFLAANVTLYHAQQELVDWARTHDVRLTLFHGRGGSIGRGGGPGGRAIRSQAPGSVPGRFKATEQGEVVFARYGNPAIGLRHLEQITSAVLTASTAEHEAALRAVGRRFAADAALMVEASQQAYRGLVDEPGFADFFVKVSPLAEITRMPIGSRPARRTGSHDLSGLRAIPWAFAWAQNRCNLPGWYGLGSGLEAVSGRHGVDRLRQMNEEWPLFASLLENAEMSLAKADPMIAGLYLERGDRPDLVIMIRDEFRRTRRQVLQATGHDRMLGARPVLRRAVDLRNPYVDALSFLQLRFLRQLRAADDEDRDGADQAQLTDLVHLTVNGIAAGLQNTG